MRQRVCSTGATNTVQAVSALPCWSGPGLDVHDAFEIAAISGIDFDQRRAAGAAGAGIACAAAACQKISMSGRLEIRCASRDEIAAVAELARESFMAAVAPHFSMEGIHTFLEFAGADRIRRRMEEGGRMLVAYDGAELVGMAHVRGEAHLALLFVAPKRQRSGIGRKLLDAVIAGTKAAVITVNSSPNAELAYRKFGFTRTADEQEVTGIRCIPMEWRRGNER